MDARDRPTAVRFKIQVPAYVIEPFALCAAKTRKDMRFVMSAACYLVPSRRPRERPSGNQQPPHFVMKNNTFRKVLGPGSVAGAAW